MTLSSTLRQERWWLSAGALAVHLAVANRYDFFRDELYFIICGRHPAWGYVDQPPVIPLLSALSQVFGEHLFVLRAISALAAAATVFVTVTLAQLLGAGRFAKLVAGLSAGFAPMYLGLTTCLSTGTFEPLSWTLLAFLTARALLRSEPNMWLWAGLVAGIDLEIKYELPVYLGPLVIGLLVTGHWRAIKCWQFAAGAVIAVLIALPSVWWQLSEGLPFVQVIHNQRAANQNSMLGPVAFMAQQVLVMNPLFAPLWLAGAIAPWSVPSLKPVRTLSVAFVISLTALLLLKAKDYYVAPLYAAMFALGAVFLEQRVSRGWARNAWLAAALTVSALSAPMALPILPPELFVEYLARTPLGPSTDAHVKQSKLPQNYADMFGWREMTGRMTEAVQKLSPEERANTVILAHNYGEAAAFEFYGRDLPPVVSTHNQYFLWGLGGRRPPAVIAFNRDVAEMKTWCAEPVELAHFYAPWVLPYEDDSAITLCRDLRPPLDQKWENLKAFD